MMNHTKLEDNLEGAQKYRLSLILEENDLDKYVNEEVPKPEGEEAKERGRITLTKDLRNSKRIIDQEGTTQLLDATDVMRKATSQEIFP